MKLRTGICRAAGGTGNPEVDERRQFLRQLGLNRNKARSLVARSFNVRNFNLRDFQRRRFRMSVELGDKRQSEVDAIVIREIFEFIEANERNTRPRTPSPPRNINWNDEPNSISPPRSRNASMEDHFRGQSFERHEKQERFVRQRSPDMDQHENGRWKHQEQQEQQHMRLNRQQNFYQKNPNFQFDYRRLVTENENENYRFQPESEFDDDHRVNYSPQERFDFGNENEDFEMAYRSRQVDDNDGFNPSQTLANRSSDNRNDDYNANFERDFGNPDFNPHFRERDHNVGIRGDFARNLAGVRNQEFRNVPYEPEFRGPQLSPPPRNLERGSVSSFNNKKPRYQRFVQADNDFEDRVFLIRDSNYDFDREVGDGVRLNEFENEQRNFMDDHYDRFEDERFQTQRQQRFIADEQFERSNDFRQNFDHHSSFINRDNPMEIFEDRNERNFNTNYNNRDDDYDRHYNGRGGEGGGVEGRHRPPNIEISRGNDFYRDQINQNFLTSSGDNQMINMRGGKVGEEGRRLPNIHNPDVNHFLQRPEQWEQRGPIYERNINDFDLPSLQNQSNRHNYRGGAQQNDRINRPNVVTATIPSQSTSGMQLPPATARIIYKNRKGGDGNRGNLGPPMTAQARNPPSSAAHCRISNNQAMSRVNARPFIAARARNTPATAAQSQVWKPTSNTSHNQGGNRADLRPSMTAHAKNQPPSVAQGQARKPITNKNKNEVGTKAKVGQPIARNLNKANIPRTGKYRKIQVKFIHLAKALRTGNANRKS